MQDKLSAVIITFNEERNIERCLKSVESIVDEIVVVDSFSTDGTKDICERYNVKFIQQAWAGYGEQKNFANAQASNSYVLSLDADEALSDELLESVKKIKETGLQGVYSFNRLTNYCGQWVRHTSWYPDTKVRIFPKDEVKWQGKIHEDLKFDLPVTHLKGDLLHYSYYTKDEHVAQIDKYSSIAAKQLHERGKRSNLLLLVIKPLARFIKNYFVELGFLDGKLGYTISASAAKANYLKYKKLQKIQRGESID